MDDAHYEALMADVRAEFGRRLLAKDEELEKLKREVEALRRERSPFWLRRASGSMLPARRQEPPSA